MELHTTTNTCRNYTLYAVNELRGANIIHYFRTSLQANEGKESERLSLLLHVEESTLCNSADLFFWSEQGY